MPEGFQTGLSKRKQKKIDTKVKSPLEGLEDEFPIPFLWRTEHVRVRYQVRLISWANAYYLTSPY